MTTSRSSFLNLVERANSAGITTVEIGLLGSFHSERHSNTLTSLSRFCDSNPAFRFPHASELRLPCIVDTTDTGEHIKAGNLSTIVLEAMLVKSSKWWKTFQSFYSTDKEPAKIIILGSERCTPPSLANSLSSSFQLIHLADTPTQPINLSSVQPPSGNENDIAVIGMACKVAGADDLDEFWDILCRGESQHTEVPEARFSFETPFRDSDPKKKWFGNFIKNHDAFDHKFFKKNPREGASMDPQQRLLLEVAYQAVEQSGYFHKPTPSLDVGCYIGTCAVDYECNVACHAPNAFSSTGNLRGFIAGKVSHYFGWTGPGLTLDTACSGAAVALHQACKAILSGECESALAGGVNMVTQPLAYQNLAAASFLSSTGQCKPFCSYADGYCRGEGIAAVYLKKRSAAIAEGDQILGIIASTAVRQNQNCTPIFVPNAPSLSDLFRKVLAQAHLDSQQISYVEAHGTGTPVGDPAEYESVSQVFAVTRRVKPLQLGSVKGLVGHTESTSGLVSLIKVLLMMHENIIPPQASFRTMNPHIKAHDSVAISTTLRPWDDTFKAALINNYGASGSNASIIVTKASTSHVSMPPEDVMYPFWFSALDERSLHAYARRLKAYLETKTRNADSISVATLSFNAFRQSNRRLNRALILSCSTLKDLQEKLSGDLTSIEKPSVRPVVFCFGGQISTSVGLDRSLLGSTTLLRCHLDRCDDVCTSLGFGSIYPNIFQKTPIEDTVKLQLCLFSLQYASARSWIDCGVQPATLVGHSFGELTALCISEVLSLHDTVKMIAGRARIIRDEWGSERGAMMAVEADLEQIQSLVKSRAPEEQVTIACFNGPRSFTLAGSAQSIDVIAQTISLDTIYSSMRLKKLNVTNAFHSALVEHLMPSLKHMTHDLETKAPVITVEFATETDRRGMLGPSFVAEHLRNPVYFHHAVKRISEKLGSCIWLEAGSNSTITTMAGRALGVASPSINNVASHVFVPVNITTDSSTTHLTSSTVALWKAGLDVTFWQHHPSQTSEYATMLLPPYQFERSRQWMELKAPTKVLAQTAGLEGRQGLWRFEGYQDPKQHSARFQIMTDSTQYREMVSDHRIAETAAICPATLEVDMAIEALMSLHPEYRDGHLQPHILSVDNHAPICLDSSRVVWLDFTAMNSHSIPCQEWNWKFISENLRKSSTATVHATGQIMFCSVDDSRVQMDFARYERLVSHQRCLDLLNSNDACDDIVQGPTIYKMFDEVVQYGTRYQGLQKLVGRRARNESAGRVVKQYARDTWLDPLLSDCFSQVGGIWVNCLTDRGAGDMYIANGFEKWFRSPKLRNSDSRPNVWDILACHERRGSNAFLTDIFIFDPRNGSLLEAILGINFAKVSKISMSKLLSRLTPDLSTRSVIDPAGDMKPTNTIMENGEVPEKGVRGKNSSSRPQDTVSPRIRLILSELSGLDASEIKDDADLADLGIDSLMGMELARELETAFDCDFSTKGLMEVISLQDLILCVRSALGIESSDISMDHTTDYITSSSSDTSPQSTARTSAIQSPSISEELTKNVHEFPAQQPVNGMNGHSGHGVPERILQLSSLVVLEAFSKCSALTDHFIEEHDCNHYLEKVMPMQNLLCVALTLEAFEQLGCDLRTMNPGQKLDRINHVASLERLVDYLYDMLEKEAHLIERNGSHFTRTSIPASVDSSSEILQALLRDSPEHLYPHKLTHFAGARLADVLSGKSDGIKVIFGTDEGRELASGLYADSPLNKLSYTQMRDFIKRLAAKLPADSGPLKILELGAGTGGTTKWIVPLLADLGIPVEYTFSDLAPSFVSAARKKFGKDYPFMKFRTVDVERPPPDDLLDSQHMLLASNAVHATHSLTRSLSNIRKTLRPDGFIMILEMTRTLYWVDMIFGLLEGWWLFDDGRRHAIAHQSRWEKDLYSVGYSHVAWTDGKHPETTIQRIFLALNDSRSRSNAPSTEVEARQAMVDTYVEKYTVGFSTPALLPSRADPEDSLCVLVTGATGSLGSHIVAHLSQLPPIKTVVCLNRRSTMDPYIRQVHALESRGINTACVSKMEVIETDTTKPMMGLEEERYHEIAGRVTHIVHNAWPMSGKRSFKGFEAQFKTMRNLLDLTSAAASVQGSVVSFQFVSSIAVVGHHPICTGNALVPEERISAADAVLPNGYGDAKWACERMIDATLHRHPQHFRAMTVRLGQIAGSRTSGYWNHMEHFTFMVRSSQTLKAFPCFEGTLSWTPVNDVAAALGDLLLQNHSAPYPIYHIDNPVRQPWSEMVSILAEALGVEIINFEEWIRRVRSYPGTAEWENPAIKLIDFFDQDYTRMSCGGLLLDTSHACEHSETLRAVRPVEPNVARKFIHSWKAAGFLEA